MLQKILICILCAATTSSVSLGCRGGDNFYGATLCFGEADPDILRDDTQKGRWILQATRFVPLPSSASEVYLCEAAYRDTVYYLVFLCNPEDLRHFVQQIANCEIDELERTEPDSVRVWFDRLEMLPEKMRPIVEQAHKIRDARYFADGLGRRVIIDVSSNRVFLCRL